MLLFSHYELDKKNKSEYLLSRYLLHFFEVYVQGFWCPTKLTLSDLIHENLYQRLDFISLTNDITMDQR